MLDLDSRRPPDEKFENVIWEGRFQPIHVGHLAYIRTLACFGRRVWIYVVANERSEEVVEDASTLPVPEFTSEVDPHHLPEKNILPFWLRYRIVVETIHDEFGCNAPITVCGGRRLDLAWDLYQKILPPNRVFLTPARDEFEKVKAAAWKKLGEENYVIDVSTLPKISATMIRERIRSDQSTRGLLSPVTEKLLSEHGYIGNLADL